MMWHILTGEYPPQAGGISDYTEQLAHGLVDRGLTVHVWCPPDSRRVVSRDGVCVHEVAGAYRLASLWRLGKCLNAFYPPRRIIVQYAPNTFGLRGCNLPFCLWLLARSRFHGDLVDVMFHEPFFYFARQRLRRNLLALLHRLMAVVLLASCRVVYVSNPAWEGMLSPFLCFRRPSFRWLPIPATIPCVQDEDAVGELRHKITRGDTSKLVIGHFGTYGGDIRGMLGRVLEALLGKDGRLLAICMGTNSDHFAAALLEDHPNLKSRLIGTGALTKREVSLHLQACDLMVQPYPDGASSRRTSLMNALAHGIPTLTTVGTLTEPIWVQSRALPLAAAGDFEGILTLAERILSDEAWRKSIGETGRECYQQNFDLERHIERLMPACSNPLTAKSVDKPCLP